MKLKWRYFLFIGLMHLIIGMLAFLLLKEQKLWFLLAEAGILLSLFLAYRLYLNLIRPIDFLASGADAIQDQDFNIKFRPTGIPEMDKLIEVYNAMIDNIRKERVQLQEQHYFLEKLIDASPSGILLLDFDNCIDKINPQAEKLLHINTIVHGRSLSELEHPVLQQLASWSSGQTGLLKLNSTEQLRCEVAHFIHQGFPRKFILLQELSKEMLQAEKRAYGKVIRMMAHEVNNSIGAINSILDTVIQFFPEGEENEDLKHSLQIARHRNDRLNNFMRNFAKVVRLPEPQLVPHLLQPILQNVQALMQAQAQERGIDIKLLLPEKPIIKSVDKEQLEQALVNMMKNALESIDQNGTIEIRLTEQPFQITIADDGPGIPADVQPKLFTPFFSTKPDGQGIGLTLVREIAGNHQASLQLETRPDGWTECSLIFTPFSVPSPT